MATKTPLIGLIKPSFNEYKNSWYIPINKNWDTVDEQLGGVIQTLTTAQGSMTDIADRLDVSLNSDGTLKSIPEIKVARSSTIYGDNPSPAGLDYALVDRIEQGDREVFYARQGFSFQLSITISSGVPTASTSSTEVLLPGMLIGGTGIPTGTTILSVDSSTQITMSANATASGAQTLNLYSNGKLVDSNANEKDDSPHNCIQYAPSGFLGFTGAVVKVDGSTYPVIADINGYRKVIRKELSTTISGSSGTYYIYLQNTLTGDLLIDRSAGVQTGEVSTYGADSKLRKFSSGTAQNFITAGVKPGDLLEITNSGSSNKNVYVVARTSAEDPTYLTVNSIAVTGLFSTLQQNLNYKVTNPASPSIGFVSTAHAKRFQRTPGRIYIGRAVFNGTSVTGVTAYSLKGRYEEWFSVSLSGGDFSTPVTHNLGFFPSKIEVFAAQNASYTTTIEPMSIAGATGGSTTLTHSVLVEATDLIINVKNATNGIFYKDYSGSNQTTGFILVRAER